MFKILLGLFALAASVVTSRTILGPDSDLVWVSCLFACLVFTQLFASNKASTSPAFANSERFLNMYTTQLFAYVFNLSLIVSSFVLAFIVANHGVSIAIKSVGFGLLYGFVAGLIDWYGSPYAWLRPR